MDAHAASREARATANKARKIHVGNILGNEGCDGVLRIAATTDASMHREAHRQVHGVDVFRKGCQRRCVRAGFGNGAHRFQVDSAGGFKFHARVLAREGNGLDIVALSMLSSRINLAPC